MKLATFAPSAVLGGLVALGLIARACIISLTRLCRRPSTHRQPEWNSTAGRAVYCTPRIPRKEAVMAHTSMSKIEKIQHPQSYYKTPDELINDHELSPDEKERALDVWEQDARQKLTASNEGMPGSEEGISQSDHHQLGQVERAKDAMRRHTVILAGRKGVLKLD
jgi:hypothetical protein